MVRTLGKGAGGKVILAIEIESKRLVLDYFDWFLLHFKPLSLRGL